MDSATPIGFLPDRLNGEPVVYRGLTSSELGFLAAGSIAFWLPICLVVSTLSGFFMMGFGAAALFALATVWVTSGWLQAMKRGRPSGFHILQLELLLHDLKLRHTPYIRRSGPWDIRRSRYVPRVARRLPAAKKP
jgi:conjugative transfer region protein (TIGR03750 family)